MATASVIGIGAAGNKAAISLIENRVIPREKTMLVNSTVKDIPQDYTDIAVKFKAAEGGCGKERDLAKNLALGALQSSEINLDSFCDPSDSFVIIVTSSEGGTGCGASTIFAKYFKDVVGVPVHLFVFTGFEDDGRGLQNTVELFQDIEEDYIVEAISNKKFLDDPDVNGNKIKAEKKANEAFAMRIKILLGGLICNSEQNIDETDLYKLTSTPGYMMIDYKPLKNIKNVEAFNKVLIDMIDNSKSLDISEPSAKRLGVIFNVSEKSQDFIDFSANVLRERLGFPYEYFQHIQNIGDTEFVAFIASGMQMPLDEIKEVYARYKEQSEKVNKKKDGFFDFVGDLRGNSEDAMFNMGSRKNLNQVTAKAKADFFGGFSSQPTTESKSTPEQTERKGDFSDTDIKINNMNKMSAKDEF